MALFPNLDDGEGLKVKIDEKAPDLFKSREGKPQLQVNKCYKKKTEEGKEVVCIRTDQEIRNMFEIKALRNVREHAPSNF